MAKKKKKEAPPKLSPREKSLNILWHAIGCAAKKQCNRDALESGSGEDVRFTIAGKVGGHQMRIIVNGDMTVAEMNPTGTTEGAKTEVLVGQLIGLIPKTRRPGIIKMMKKNTDKKGKLVKPENELLAHAKSIIKSLQKSKPKNGAVQFDHEVVS